MYDIYCIQYIYVYIYIYIYISDVYIWNFMSPYSVIQALFLYQKPDLLFTTPKF